MKRLIAVLLVALLTLVLAACEAEPTTDPDIETEVETEVETEAPSLAEVVEDEIQPVRWEQWAAVDPFEDENEYLVDRLMEAAEGKGMQGQEVELLGDFRIWPYSFEDGSELRFTLDDMPDVEGAGWLVDVEVVLP